MKQSVGVLLSFLLLFFYPLSAMADGGDTKEERIVLVADVSGSVAEHDPTYYIKEALHLAVGIAPDRATVSVMCVNSEVITDTGFVNASQSADRAQLTHVIDNIKFDGNTNLVLGIQYAIDALDGPGRVILLADISEGGLTADNNVAAWVEQAETLASVCSAQAVSVDLILMGVASDNEDLALAIENIAIKSGGTVYRAETPVVLPAFVEQIYFSNFSYTLWPVTGVNTSGESQIISMDMPTNFVHRARVYTPSPSIQASYAGAGLETQNHRTFSLLDLSRPGRDGFSLIMAPESGRTDIYLITDYYLEEEVTISSQELQTDNAKEHRQETTIIFDALDQDSGKSILDDASDGELSMHVVFTAPDGSNVILRPQYSEGKFIALFEPEIYGAYAAEISLSYNEQSLFYTQTWLEIEELPAKATVSPGIVAAIIIGILMIVLALLYAASTKKQKGESVQQAVRPVKDPGFSGKMQVATVIADGGKAEIPPFQVELRDIEAGRLTLAELYEGSGMACPYIGCEKVIFLPGPGESIILKNNSPATILASGREYTAGQKIQLHYNEKAYIIFEADQDEIEVYYRALRSPANNSQKLSFSTQ